MTGSHPNHSVDGGPDRAACSSAFSDANLFHRDASFGNIMIGRDNRGRLNDWDLCRGVNVDKSLEGPRTVSGPSHATAIILMFVRREPGSSCPQSYSQILGRDIR